MGVKAEKLAKQFETKAAEATRLLERLTDADWKMVTEAEGWTVGVTAHHVAITHEAVANIITSVAAGQSVPNLTLDLLHATNAKHAQDYAHCTKPETIELHTKGAATAVAVVRALSDDQLGKSGTVVAGAPMTAEQVITDVLINHIDDHFGSIRRTIGR